MADTTNIMGEVGGQLLETVFSGILWFGIAILIIGVVGFLGWFFLVHKRRFSILVKVTSERANDKNRIIFDKAAILVDRKDKSKFFRLWGLKLDLPAPRFNVLQSTSKGDYLELYRTSEDTIYYLTSSVIDKTKIIRGDGKSYLLASQKNKQIDPDMAFWGTRRMMENKKMFDTESLLMKLLPFLPQILGGMFMIFILYIFLDHLPGILGQISELSKDLQCGSNPVQTIATGVATPA